MIISDRGTGDRPKMKFVIPSTKTTTPQTGEPTATDSILTKVYAVLRAHPDAHAAVENAIAQTEHQL